MYIIDKPAEFYPQIFKIERRILMQLTNDWYLSEADTSNNDFIHREPTEEIEFYNNVVTGNIDAVRSNCEEHRFSSDLGVGRLSRNPVTNIKYHFVVTAALVTRYCIQYGMESEKAFRLSDFYICKLDDKDTVESVVDLHDQMVMDFTGRMRLLKYSSFNSKPVNECLNYIYSHIKERLNVEDIADAIGISASYLSRVFKKETGSSVSDYIREQKIDAAINLLKFSDYPIVEISERFGFSSQSHFTQAFKNVTGMTPYEYRKSHGHSEWNVHDSK